MDPKSWKILKDKLIELRLDVKTVGKSKKEYVANNDKVTFDILRGGLTGSGMSIELFVFDGVSSALDKVIVHDHYRHYTDVLHTIQSILNDYEEFTDEES